MYRGTTCEHTKQATVRYGKVCSHRLAILDAYLVVSQVRRCGVRRAGGGGMELQDNHTILSRNLDGLDLERLIFSMRRIRDDSDRCDGWYDLLLTTQRESTWRSKCSGQVLAVASYLSIPIPHFLLLVRMCGERLSYSSRKPETLASRVSRVRNGCCLIGC